MQNCLVYNNRVLVPQLTPLTYVSKTLRKHWIKPAIWLGIIRSMRLMIKITPQWNKVSLNFAHNAKNLATQKKFVDHSKRKKLSAEKSTHQPKETYSQNYSNRQKALSNYRSTQTVTLTTKAFVGTVQILQTAVVAEVPGTPELFTLKQDLTSLTRCMTLLQSCNLPNY